PGPRWGAMALHRAVAPATRNGQPARLRLRSLAARAWRARDRLRQDAREARGRRSATAPRAPGRAPVVSRRPVARERARANARRAPREAVRGRAGRARDR